MATDPTTVLTTLVEMLDEAVDIQETKGCCSAVKNTLEKIVGSDHDFIDLDLLKPDPNKYARRLVHKDPAGRYSVVAMVWGPGQGTLLHDHAGHWCVECVYRGRIDVESYDLIESKGDLMKFKKEGEIVAGVGEAGALIPPFEYHSIKNADTDGTSAVTLHVYGGELTWCHCFLPEGEWFKKEIRELVYTP